VTPVRCIFAVFQERKLKSVLESQSELCDRKEKNLMIDAGIATVDITKADQDKLNSWAEAEGIPLQALIDAVFAAGLVVFERADAQPDEVRAILDAVRQRRRNELE
jgi:hypothetical protein